MSPTRETLTLTWLQISDPTNPDPPATNTVEVEGPMISASACSEDPGGGVRSPPPDVWGCAAGSAGMSRGSLLSCCSASASGADDMNTLRYCGAGAASNMNGRSSLSDD